MPRITLVAGLLTIALWVGGTSPIPVEAAPPDAGGAIDPAALLADPALESTARIQLTLFQQINAARAEAGLPPYALDARLMASAGAHAADMAAGHYCRHTGRDGSSSRSRIRANGYPHSNWAGENIVCSRRSVESALRWWLGSGPHRRNLLHRHYTHIGIGYDPGGPMWVLNFAAGAGDTVAPRFTGLEPTSVPPHEPG